MLWPYLLVRIRKSPWHISTLKNPTPLFRETIKFRTFCESRNNWGIFVNIVADVLFYVSISRGRYSSMFTKIGARYTGAHSREILSTSTKYLNSKFFKGGKASRIVPAPLDIIRRHFVFPGQGAKSCSVCHVSSINDCDWLSLTPSCPRHSWGFTGKNSRGNLRSLSFVTLALETFTLYSRSLARTIFRLVLVSSAKKKNNNNN